MNTTPATSQPETSFTRIARGISLTLMVTDPDSVAELGKRAEGPEREAFATEAFRIGVLAMRGANGAVDTNAIRREHERTVAAMGELLSERGRALEEILGNAVELIAHHVGGDDSTLATTIARSVGESSPMFKLLSPEQSNGVVATLSKTVETALRDQREKILEQFSLDRQDSALSRLAATLTTTLSDLAAANMKFHVEMRAALEAHKAHRTVVARTPVHGLDFEEALGGFVARDAQQHGDVYEDVRAKPGQCGRKVGDHVVALGPEACAAGARLTLEAKGRKGFSDVEALVELALARENRRAQVGIFVRERASAAEGTVPLRRIGRDIIVTWDAEDPTTDVWLDAALSIARALCVVVGGETQADADASEIESAIREIAKLAAVIDDVGRTARAIKTKGEHVSASADSMRDVLQRQIAVLRKHVGASRRGSERFVNTAGGGHDLGG